MLVFKDGEEFDIKYLCVELSDKLVYNSVLNCGVFITVLEQSILSSLSGASSSPISVSSSSPSSFTPIKLLIFGLKVGRAQEPLRCRLRFHTYSFSPPT